MKQKGGTEMYYEGVCCNYGKIVPEEDAFDYALSEMSKKEELEDYKRCYGEDFDESSLCSEEDRQEFVEWFFSGNWTKEVGKCTS